MEKQPHGCPQLMIIFMGCFELSKIEFLAKISGKKIELGAESLSVKSKTHTRAHTHTLARFELRL